jgi:hypothetical protein
VAQAFQPVIFRIIKPADWKVRPTILKAYPDEYRIPTSYALETKKQPHSDLRLAQKAFSLLESSIKGISR